MKRLLIVDGHNLLFQMFFGMPSRIEGKSGRDIRGIIGFVGAIGRLMDMLSPSHMIVLFDSETHNPRCDILDEYKANRPDYGEMPDEENPFSILDDVKRALEVMGIKSTEVKDAEVDDVIAAYCLTKDKDTEIFVSSFDSDFFQLIRDDVRILRYRGKCSQICDKEYLYEKLGIAPEHYAFHKALTGDSSDNIKGVPGIGPKTATKLLCAYGGIETIFDAEFDKKDEKFKEKLISHQDLVLRNYKLIKLDSDAPIPYNIDELIITKTHQRTMQIISLIGE